MSFDENLEPKNLSKPKTPELVDLKITDWCDRACKWCAQNSTPNGKHASLDTVCKIINDLATCKTFEVACLHGDTVTFGPSGAVLVKDIDVGNVLYDGNGNECAVVKTRKSNKNCITLVCNKGLKITCTKDHPFIINGNIVMAKDMLGKKFDLSAPTINTKMVSTIDMSKFVQASTRNNKRGGNAGGKVVGNKCRLNQRCVWIDRTITLTKDLMWLYGLVVAEGSCRGISLHKKEVDIANRAIDIYKKTFGIGGNIRNSGNNGIVVEFYNSSIYRAFFFEALGVGYGARNKSIFF
jgi:hypothetical protein